MYEPLLFTKLYIPPPRPKIILRPRLIERLNEIMHCKLTLISAPAGFGKTTLVSEWLAGCERPVAWLSLDEGDNDPARFLTYLVAALQTIAAKIGKGVLAILQSPQPPPIESILIALLNEITTVPDNFVLVLDDYHMIDSKPVDEALTFLLEHLPPQMHLVIATREDPQLPLARLRARGQLTELRAADLRFTPSEAAEFLNQMMGLNLSEENIAALEARTEGWIAGLQLAALSMQGRSDAASFIKSFTGSHHFVLDYLIEEVLQQQSASIQTFLLRTSILDRMCGPLCDAVLGSPSASGQETLEYLERANLFIVPLDNERRWYRYHHLFAELLRQRLQQSDNVAEYHIRASAWYEDNGLDIEAFQHAAAANDIERAERLMEERGGTLRYRDVVTTILDWLVSLPTTVLDARPLLWVRSATLSLVTGQRTGVEEKLQAAEVALAAALQDAEPDDKTRDLIGQIATARATLALTHYQPEAMITQSRRALEYLHPDNLLSRFRANWMMAMAYFFRGERAVAGQANAEALSIAQASGNNHNIILATTLLGQIQELENQLYLAAETFRRVPQLIGDDYSPPVASEAYLGLSHICYEWNDLDAAEQHGQQSLQLSRQYDRVIDRYILSEVFLARLKLARGDVAGAAAMLAETEQSVRQNNFVHRMPEVAAAQVLVLLRQGDLAAAAQLAKTHELPINQARVHLAQGDPSAALDLLSQLRQQMEAKDWQDERLKVMVLQAVTLHALGEKDKAVQLLSDALALAEPGGFIRIFVDEGAPMAQLLFEASSHGVMPDYIAKLLAVFEAEKQPVLAASPGKSEGKSYLPPVSPAQPLIEPLSQRELKILQLIAQGLSNREISERLFLALSTVKGHNRNIFDKLQVQSRTEAVARARELGLL
jgi:LuxR family maltose regulon positive regulatory protein